MGGMIEPLLLQPTQVTSAPRYLAREDATVLEHEAAHLLAMHTEGLNRTRSRANEIAHRLMALVGHPHWREFAGP